MPPYQPYQDKEKGQDMTETTKKKTRRLFVFVLASGMMCSMMYVSFAFGFRAGVMEDTVFVLPQC